MHITYSLSCHVFRIHTRVHRIRAKIEMHSNALDAIYMTKGRVHSVMTRFSYFYDPQIAPSHFTLLGNKNKMANTFLVALISRYIRDRAWIKSRDQSKPCCPYSQ